MSENTKGSNIFKVIIVVLSYWVISISMVFFNKFLLGDRKDEDLSLFVTWLQCVITVIMASLINCFTKSYSLTSDISNFSKLFPVFTMAFFFVCMLSFNNMCLKVVGVPFYQIARSTTIIFMVIFSIIILQKKISLKIMGCCLMVMAGFILGVDQESMLGTISWKGIAFGVTSSVFIALTGIYTKKALEVVQKNELKLTTMVNIISSFLFIPILMYTGELQRALMSEKFYDKTFWSVMLSTGILGLAISWISAVQINVTSPISHNISSNFKAILQTVIAVAFYHEIKTASWWLSVGLVCLGAFLYAFFKFKEEQELKATQEVNTEEKALP